MIDTGVAHLPLQMSFGPFKVLKSKKNVFFLKHTSIFRTYNFCTGSQMLYQLSYMGCAATTQGKTLLNSLLFIYLVC